MRPTTATLPGVTETPVVRLGGGGGGSADRIAIEAPLEVRIGRRTATVLMRTPGEDEDLVLGFLFTEGIIARPADVVALRRPPDLGPEEQDNVIAVELSPALAAPKLNRSQYSSSACGVCGKNSIAALAVKGEPSASKLSIRREVLASLPERLRAAQPAFLETGGVHASGLFTAQGDLIAVREDVGRHNALDKLVGWALRAGALPLDERVLVVSGRVSYEIIQKAVAASLPVVAAVGAPSSYAVDLAGRFHMTLVGFLRPDSMNVYTGRERIAG